MTQTRFTSTKISSPPTPVKASSELIMKTPNKYIDEDNDQQRHDKSNETKIKSETKSESENKGLGRQTVLVVTKVNVTPVRRSARNFTSEKNNSNSDGTIITTPVSVEALAKDLRSLTIEDPPSSSKTKKVTNKCNVNATNNADDIACTPWDIIDDTTPDDSNPIPNKTEESSDNKTSDGTSTVGRIWRLVDGFRVLRSARLLNRAAVHSA
mmetsp:Transcript_5054/g.7662  ORF Transcript_5054/g.7662 Transcript_5054/m.7662 type:complete len:211 (-) Transcript_5054:94-726(-)